MTALTLSTGCIIRNRATGAVRPIEEATADQLARWVARGGESARVAQREIDRRATEALLAQQKADYELRQDVIEELVAEGKARHVAENLTNTEAKMLAEARRLGVI